MRRRGCFGGPAKLVVVNLYDALRESHDIQRSLCRTLTSGRARPETRLGAFRELAVELAAHAAAEERFLYVPMLMDDAGLNVSRHALAEHHELDELVERLRGVDPDTDDFADGARDLAHKVNHHLGEEEQGFFQLSGRILDAATKRDLAKRYVADYGRLKAAPAT